MEKVPKIKSRSTTPDFLYNGKENIEELDFNMLEYGFRLYDPAIGRFPSVDPIADNFAWVSGFNYAENDPVKHIDLWGLQKFYGRDGAFLGKHGSSNEERYIWDKKNERKATKVLNNGDDAQKEYFINQEFLSDDFSVKILRETDIDAVYDEFAKNHKNDPDREHARVIYKGTFTDENGASFKGLQIGSLATGKKIKHGFASVFLGDSKIKQDCCSNIGFWSPYSAIHNHPDNDDFSGMDEWPKYGFYTTTDIGWAYKFNAPVLLIRPNSNQIATFDPAIFKRTANERGIDKYSRPLSIRSIIKHSISSKEIGNINP